MNSEDDLSKSNGVSEISKADFSKSEKQKKIKAFKETIVTPYINNALQAMRTAGALLIGNSVLVILEVIGKNGANFWSIVNLGVLLVLISSWPFGVKSEKEK